MVTRALATKITQGSTRHMKGYVIYLPEFKNSVAMAHRALETGKQYEWNLELFQGVNGLKETLGDYNIWPCAQSKKAARYMARPGTAGCFLSQFKLWNKCIDLNTPINIFEHDVVFKKPMGNIEDCDVYKFEGFNKSKPTSIGTWYEGARAYTITPTGANKIVQWVKEFGALPADWLLNEGIVKMKFDKYNKVSYQTDVSFTKDLK